MAAVNPQRNDLLPPPVKNCLASILFAGAILLPGPLATPAHAATTLLHSFFEGSNNGTVPLGGPTLSGSKLYGMTSGGGGASDAGVVFSMNTDGTGFGVLHRFSGGANDGAQPLGSVTLSGTKVYGMTYKGG